jgi:hypothetical protein
MKSLNIYRALSTTSNLIDDLKYLICEYCDKTLWCRSLKGLRENNHQIWQDVLFSSFDDFRGLKHLWPNSITVIPQLLSCGIVVNLTVCLKPVTRIDLYSLLARVGIMPLLQLPRMKKKEFENISNLKIYCNVIFELFKSNILYIYHGEKRNDQGE